MQQIVCSFHQREKRRVHPDFSDIQLNKQLFKVDPKLRGDRVEVRFDPFGQLDTVEIYSIKGEYIGVGTRHQRQIAAPLTVAKPGKPKHNYLDIITKEHQQQLQENTQGIDFCRISQQRPWPFCDFANTIASFLGKKGGLSDFTAQDLESLKKLYNQSILISKPMVKKALQQALKPELPYVIFELKNLIKKENG
jgi:hypothetical protein